MPLVIQVNDLWDPVENVFITSVNQKLVLEHCLYSVAQWEQKYKVPFLSERQKSLEEMTDYIRFMTLNASEVDERIYKCLPMSAYKKIDAYIGDPMTATTFHEWGNSATKAKASSKAVTAETIYYSMFSYGIDISFEKRHLNSLIALIRMFTVNNGGQKMSKSEARAMQYALNESRLAKKR